MEPRKKINVIDQILNYDPEDPRTDMLTATPQPLAMSTAQLPKINWDKNFIPIPKPSPKPSQPVPVQTVPKPKVSTPTTSPTSSSSPESSPTPTSSPSPTSSALLRLTRQTSFSLTKTPLESTKSSMKTTLNSISYLTNLL